MCRCLKVKSLLSQADGSEEKVYEKVRVVNLAFYKTIDDRIRRLGGEFKDNFGRGGGGNLKDPILKSSNAQERGWGCWSFELIDAETEISRKVKCSLRVTLWNKFPGFAHSGLVIGFKLATYSLAVWCWLPSSWSITQCTEMWKLNI